MQVVDAQIAEREEECSGKLYAKLMYCFHSVQVVEYADKVYEQRADGKENGGEIDVEILSYSSVHDGKCSGDTNCH